VPYVTPVTLPDAIVGATWRGVACRVVCTVNEERHEMLVGLTTTDADPTVSLMDPAQKENVLLAQREASGPERWDYSASISRTKEEYFLEFRKGEVVQVVPFLPAASSVLKKHGWKDPSGLLAEPLLDKQLVQEAINAVTREDGGCMTTLLPDRGCTPAGPGG